MGLLYLILDPVYTVHAINPLNPVNADLNPICHLLALLGAHPIIHISGVRVKKFIHHRHGCCACRLMFRWYALQTCLRICISLQIGHEQLFHAVLFYHSGPETLALCRWVSGSGRFEATQCLLLQGLILFNPWNWTVESRSPDDWASQWFTEWGVVWGIQTPLSKFRRSSKIVPNSTRLWKLLKIAEFRILTPQDIRKKGCKILKLPSVRNCFTLAMTNEFVVIIDSLKVPKIKKNLLYEMKFLVPNCSCLQNPWLGGYRPQIPVLSVSCPQPNLLNPPPRTKFLGTPLGRHILKKPNP